MIVHQLLAIVTGIHAALTVIFLNGGFLFKSVLITRCFGLYGHHQVLKLLHVGNCCASSVLVLVFFHFLYAAPSMC
jgi:hypothetical protein